MTKKMTHFHSEFLADTCTEIGKEVLGYFSGKAFDSLSTRPRVDFERRVDDLLHSRTLTKAEYGFMLGARMAIMFRCESCECDECCPDLH